MKNIHILPTDNSSRLGIYNGTLTLHRQGWRNGTQHIYITSDEYIGLSYYLDGNLVRKGVVDDKDYWEVRKDYKKIILTTDQDLINDGVQAIDDEFLEWFVKNPSCREVVVEKYGYMPDETCQYKIIIPKEEPKQEFVNSKVLSENGNKLFFDKEGNLIKEEPKQETLEQAAEHYAHNYFDMHDTNHYKALKQGFRAGSAWQEKRMYSEQQMDDAYDKGILDGKATMYSEAELLIILESHKNVLEFDKDRFDHNQWFEQFKK